MFSSPRASRKPSAFKETLLSITFFVVAFSILVQGLTFSPLAARLARTPISA